jgi:hypothetical protein
MYANPGGNGYVWDELREQGEMGWQEFGMLEFTVLPSILEEYWLPALEAADVIWVGGGNTGYLNLTESRRAMMLDICGQSNRAENRNRNARHAETRGVSCVVRDLAEPATMVA